MLTGTISDTQDRVVNKTDKTLSSSSLHSSWGEKQINMHVIVISAKGHVYVHMCCSKQSGQREPQKRLVSHKNIGEYSILGRGNSKYKDKKVGRSSAFQVKTRRPCALRKEQGKKREEMSRDSQGQEPVWL